MLYNLYKLHMIALLHRITMFLKFQFCLIVLIVLNFIQFYFWHSFPLHPVRIFPAHRPPRNLSSWIVFRSVTTDAGEGVQTVTAPGLVNCWTVRETLFCDDSELCSITSFAHWGRCLCRCFLSSISIDTLAYKI